MLQKLADSNLVYLIRICLGICGFACFSCAALGRFRLSCAAGSDAAEVFVLSYVLLPQPASITAVIVKAVAIANNLFITFSSFLSGFTL